MLINKENTIGLVIDMQEKLLPHMNNSEAVKRNGITLIKGLKALNIPILVTQQYTKGLGATDTDISEALGEFTPIEKTAFSCYRVEEFIEKIKSSGKQNVIIIGVESHVCVQQTALDLVYNKFKPILINNAIESRKAEDKEMALIRMKDAGCTLATYESILFELCLKAGSDEFKAISKLVK